MRPNIPQGVHWRPEQKEKQSLPHANGGSETLAKTVKCTLGDCRAESHTTKTKLSRRDDGITIVPSVPLQVL